MFFKKEEEDWHGDSFLSCTMKKTGLKLACDTRWLKQEFFIEEGTGERQSNKLWKYIMLEFYCLGFQPFI